MGPTTWARTSVADAPADPVQRDLAMKMRVRQEEMTACDLIAGVLYSQSHMPWSFYYDLARHVWDEARHAMFGQAALEADGYRVAIDARDFAANASFLQEMERSIRESRFTVAIISRRYLDSGHTEEEAVIAKVLDMGDRKRRLIPLLIEPVTMPAWLYGIVGIDCTKRDPLVDPFDKLKATLGTPLATAMDAG